jgi:hypothetical protein
MRRFGQALAIVSVFLFFSPDWVPLEAGMARVVVAVLFSVGLTVAVMGAVLGSLPENAKITSIGHGIPAVLQPLVRRIEGLGFERLGSALRVHLEPPAYLVALWHEGDRTYSTVFASDGAPDKAHFDYVTMFQPGEVGLTSSANVGAGVLPPADGSFLQIFPGEAPEQLLECHRQGCEHLVHAARVQPRAKAATFEFLLAGALARQRAAFMRAPLRNTWTALFRVLRKSSPAVGPVGQQPATQARIDALRTEFPQPARAR